MRIAFATLAVVVALALQTTVAFSLMGLRPAVDLVLVVVIYVALGSGPAGGLLVGSVAGLAQDALSGGVVGVCGLAKCVVGFLAGILGTQFIVVNAVPRFVVFFLGSLLHSALFLGLYQVIDPGAFGRPYTTALSQALVNSIVGIFAFHVVERAPHWWHHRKLRRAAFRR